jgi:photosystem II stability/assembly factor-like uncharacterized protein
MATTVPKVTDEGILLAGAFAIYTQLDGPNSTPEYLGCHDFGDTEQGFGDMNLIFCPDSSRANQWNVSATYQSASEPGEFTIESATKETRGALNKIKRGCGLPFYSLAITCGRKDTFANWKNATIYYPTILTTSGQNNRAKREPGDQGPAIDTFTFQFAQSFQVWRPIVGRQDIGETTALNDITACSVEQCAGKCGPGEDSCDSMAVAGDAPAGSPGEAADVWSTSDGGGTWSLLPSGPFADAIDVASIDCFEINSDTTRYIAAQGTTAPAAPMQIAYRDGTTGAWTRVTVGSVNGQYALGPKALFALDKNHIWLAASGGYVYFSNDGGATWTAQTSGGTTAENLIGIRGSSTNDLYAVGENDAIIKTTDGGLSWILVTATGGGNNLRSLSVISKQVVWVVDSGGQMYYTIDGGTTWTERAFSDSGTGEGRDIEFANELVGFMLHNDATPNGRIFQTINGGQEWELLDTTPTNSGLNAIVVCGVNLAYAVGEPQGGTAAVFKIEPS